MVCANPSVMSPVAWDDTLSAPPVLSSGSDLLRGGLLRRWTGTSGDMDQPALDHHYIVLHLGGPKRVRRAGEGGRLISAVYAGQLTVVPAGSVYDWSTEGPIDFAHLYIDPRRVDRAVSEVFDREPRAVDLQDRLGFSAPLLERILLTMLDEIREENEAPPRLYLEGLFDAALLHLIRLVTNVATVSNGVRQAMAPHRLRRVKDFIEAHLAEDIDLQRLADTAGLSRFHFSRTFQQSTGFSPYLYVTRSRIARAKAALADTTQSVAQIARMSGFNSAAQFSSTFKKLAGASPREWRQCL